MPHSTVRFDPAAMLPRTAVWLLKTWGSPRYRECLLGDLVEQRCAGRSIGWCWSQVAWALWLARLEGFRSGRWSAAVKALIVTFGIAALGAGTLAWAESVHVDAHRAESCSRVESCSGHIEAAPGG
jgi:hypothetical protein